MFDLLTKTHAFQTPAINWMLLIVRIHAGLSIAINAGLSKVMEFPVAQWFIDDLAKAGFPFPELMAALASWGEVIGGFMLAAGLLTRFSAALVGVIMFVAAYVYQGITPVVSMHIAQSYFFLFLTFAAIGGGKFSLDYWFRTKKAPQVVQAKVAALIMLCCLLPVFSNTAFGQVKGNGEIETRTIPAASFEKLHINFPVEATITLGKPFSVEMTTDENIFRHVGINTNSGQLDITQDKWIQPSEPVKLVIGAPNLEALKIGGYSDILLKNVNTYQLDVSNAVGDVSIEGQVDVLRYDSKTGHLFAEKLNAKFVYAQISSFGTALVNATEVIDADVPNNGKIVYTTVPEEIKQRNENSGPILSIIENDELRKNDTKLPSILFRLKNNTIKKVNIYIKGPLENPFGYGISFMPLQKKRERFPIGTNIYHVKRNGERVLLYTVKSEDEDQTVKLFDKNN